VSEGWAFGRIPPMGDQTIVRPLPTADSSSREAYSERFI